MTAAHDERLAGLLEKLSARERQGQPSGIDEEAAANPDLAGELRELWAAAQVADLFARAVPKLPKPRPRPEPKAVAREFGDYEIGEEIGRGGMGVVYKAWQKSLGREVALKMILKGEHATPADVARFKVEAQAAAHLDHPNIVPVYAAGEQDGQAFFSMRLVEGETLTASLGRGPMRSRDAASLLARIARGVDFAHQRGILHRDLKPSNILIDRDGTPRITDFGLAKRVADNVPGHHLTHSGAIVGTPAYMAPEMVTGRRGPAGPASDVYSLGVILYEMLTGRPPFQAPTPVDTLLLVLDQDPVRPADLNPMVDRDLELICLKCIQKEPELRYQSAAELAIDLEAYLHGDQLTIRRTTFADLANFFGRLFRETHHAVVLENWGLLWMVHSAMVLVQCVLTAVLAWNGFTQPLWYLGLWGGGLVAWGGVFWNLRKKAGPVLFVERQVAHVWGSAVLATIGVFVVEMLLGLHVLTLAPLLAVIAGMTFVVKGGMLTGAFYVQAAAEFAAVVPMAWWSQAGHPEYGILLFGVVTALSFFLPGLKYHRLRQRSLAAKAEGAA
ncbi:MAG: serine/threonine protein kinase [Gemmataceae bacterium]|nr:serine/threonine protein kinase [Gemmataceae bacterium]